MLDIDSTEQIAALNRGDEVLREMRALEAQRRAYVKISGRGRFRDHKLREHGSTLFRGAFATRF